MSTAGVVSLRTLNLDTADRVDYVPSGWLTLRQALAKYDVSESDVFLDFGSGKGQIVLQAAMYPFRRVLGVEISPQLHNIAVQNVQRARRRLRCRDIVLINSPAEQFDIPDDVSIVYFFNPFRGETFNSVMRALLASVDRDPRPLRIIYHNAREEEFLLATGRVQIMRTISTGPGNAPTRIYQIIPPLPGRSRASSRP